MFSYIHWSFERSREETILPRHIISRRSELERDAEKRFSSSFVAGRKNKIGKLPKKINLIEEWHLFLFSVDLVFSFDDDDDVSFSVSDLSGHPVDSIKDMIELDEQRRERERERRR